MTTRGHDGTPWLQVEGLSKRFGGVQALDGIDLAVRHGEVHGLVGANGAGKSTLIKMLAGLETPDSGTIRIAGEVEHIETPGAATSLGLSFIHQELNLVLKFDAVRNMTLGQPKPTRLGLIDWRAVRRHVDEVAERLDLRFPLHVPVEDLSVADQWLVSIGRALLLDASMIAMDEPTASLSEQEAERLFEIIRDLTADGIAVLYVSHRLDEILELCDDVTVFKDGRKVATTPRDELSKGSLIDSIVGEAPQGGENLQSDEEPGRVVLDVRDLVQGERVRGVSFQVHEGEVLGLAGLVGAGRTELVRTLFGADRRDGGQVDLNGRPFAPKTPHDAVARGVGLVPEERRAQGVVLDKSIDFNINLPDYRSVRMLPWLPMIRLGRARKRARRIADRLQVKSAGVQHPVRSLSGGNQQKVVIGKWLTQDLQLLILDEPSRGVDVGARAEIHRIIRELADGGTAVIVISSELEEFEGFCDRVLVMAGGRVAGELGGDEITEERMLQMSYHHGQEYAGGTR